MWLQHALTDLGLSTRGEKEDECFEISWKNYWQI